MYPFHSLFFRSTAAFVLSLGAPFFTHAGPPGEVWLTSGVHTSLSPETQVGMIASSRWRDDAVGFYALLAEAQLYHALGPEWRGELGLRGQKNRSSSGPWRREIRPTAAVTWSSKLATWNFAIRNRAELRSLESQDDVWRYRLRFAASPPPASGAFWRFEFSQELFYDFRAGAYNQNWLFGGIRLDLPNDWRANVHTGWVSRKRAGSWSHAPLLGLRLSKRL